ncbi:actin filament organization protein-like protein App1-like protein [Westerdykella ornata]|uniref:Actin filament organization protein-like protein App1-like protein n=1 Tax=Westerdykella ornata TaxID=318751 RepID=A0A6A6J5K4_WESOR|nr:actin filament organization protein-like protein App1-like protein [Westerdykella ornata]KAF2271861.1 actin filament organization protein-like protein App1-like protein [Westerdykella ornata]
MNTSNISAFSPSALAEELKGMPKETEQDRITRSSGRFADIEHDMPSLPHRFKFDLKDNLSSWLGSRNPLFRYVDPSRDLVWLFDNTAYQDRSGRWKAEFVAAYFVKDSGEDLSDVVAWVADKVGLAQDDEAKRTIENRIQPMLDTIVPARACTVDIEGSQSRLGPSGRSGISSDIVALPTKDHADGQVIKTRVKESVAKQPLNANLRFATPTGWAVISDIDDTIKKTLTPDPIGILRTTFAEDPEPIRGMPELYKHISQKLDNPPFWYLSASPYNLYPFLREFRDQYYPPGTMILRDASWMNLAGFFADLTQGTQAYKVDRMVKIHGWFPKRKFICIGDSTQSDPEAFGEAYRKFPKWIGAIFIRKVTGVAEMDEARKNAPERFTRAFEGVPDDVWYVFEDPNELYAKVDALTATR